MTISVKIHKIKIQEQWVDSVLDGSKPFELRLNDRNYQKGDYVVMESYYGLDPSIPARSIKAQVGYVLSVPRLRKWVVFGLQNISEVTRND